MGESGAITGKLTLPILIENQAYITALKLESVPVSCCAAQDAHQMLTNGRLCFVVRPILTHQQEVIST